MFDVLVIIFLAIGAMALVTICLFLIFKERKDASKNAIMSHRQLWLYYLQEPELAGLLSNNNGNKECEIDADNMTEKQYRFLVLFLNHMEHMLPSYDKYKRDWIGLFKNACLRKVYENTKLYRSKKFCKLIDGIIAGYDEN